MPYKSEAQRRFFNSPAGKAKIGAEEVEKWNEESKGKKAPEKAIDKAISLCDSIVIKNVRGHWEAYKDGKFYGSGDTKGELLKDLENDRNLEKEWQIVFLDKYDHKVHIRYKTKGIWNKIDAQKAFEKQYKVHVLRVDEI